MKQRGMWERFSMEAGLEEETIPGQPIVELAGDRRVFIEDHRGVREYSRERITVGMKYGAIQICGCGLELSSMTRNTLLIRGRIDCVEVKRRDCR